MRQISLDREGHSGDARRRRVAEVARRRTHRRRVAYAPRCRAAAAGLGALTFAGGSLSALAIARAVGAFAAACCGVGALAIARAVGALAISRGGLGALAIACCGVGALTTACSGVGALAIARAFDAFAAARDGVCALTVARGVGTLCTRAHALFASLVAAALHGRGGCRRCLLRMTFTWMICA
jgi:hypothetical protein